MHTTAAEFANLMVMLMNQGIFEGRRILSAESVKAMMTPTGMRNSDGWTQGLGIFGPKDLRGRQVWGHPGADRGAATMLFFNPETGVGAVVFANSMDTAWTMDNVVADLTLHLMAWFE